MWFQRSVFLTVLALTVLPSGVSSELQQSLGHGAGRPGGGTVPAEGEQRAEQEHVQLSLPGCHRQGGSAGGTHRGHYGQRAGR